MAPGVGNLVLKARCAMSARVLPLAPRPAQVNEPALFYAPPYARPVEDEFAWHLVKYLDERAGLLYQDRVATPAGPVWVDFVVELPAAGGTRRVGFELTDPADGADPDDARYRDALLVGGEAAPLDALYRLDTRSALYRLHDALHLVDRWERAAGTALFSERGRINLDRLATADARAVALAADGGRAYVAAFEAPLDDAEVDADPFEAAPPLPPLRLDRRSAAHPATFLRDYDAAFGHFGLVAPPRRLTTAA